MDVGVGLPATIPGASAEHVLEAGRRADSAGFASVGIIDRLVYDNFEPLTTLAAVAAVTERVRLTTAILIAPNRGNAALLAKQAASVDAISGGRLVLGLAIGARDDDYEAAGVPTKGRGRRLEQYMEELQSHWSEGDIGPKPARAGGPPLWVGGSVDAAYRRAAQYGQGWIMGGGTPEMLAEGAEQTRAAFKEAGRDDEPRIGALAYFALGDTAEEDARSYLGDYYAFMGESADMVVQSAATDEDTIKGYVQAFEQAGCDELILFPCSADPEQVELLAKVVL